MSAQHTPGPWAVYNANEGDDPAFRPLWCVANTNWHEGRETDCLDLTIYNGCEADAHLVAAAPDMLAALRDITPSMPAADARCHAGIVPQSDCARCGRIRRALDAIAKAEGRS